jgi:hypothetical protein
MMANNSVLRVKKRGHCSLRLRIRQGKEFQADAPLALKALKKIQKTERCLPPTQSGQLGTSLYPQILWIRLCILVK